MRSICTLRISPTPSRCSYEKCCKHLENCIDDGVFGPEAYLDMRRKCLVVTGKPPEPTPKKAKKPKVEKADPMPEKDQYQKILDELRRVNDAIPDEEMTDKISRLEAVSAKIFEPGQVRPRQAAPDAQVHGLLPSYVVKAAEHLR